MKQHIKRLIILLLVMNIFTASQEKTCVGNVNLSATTVLVDNDGVCQEEAAAIAESDVQLMPIGRVIIMQ
jgi:hypothetical protein